MARVSSNTLEEPRDQTLDPWIQGECLIHYPTAALLTKFIKLSHKFMSADGQIVICQADGIIALFCWFADDFEINNVHINCKFCNLCENFIFAYSFKKTYLQR